MVFRRSRCIFRLIFIAAGCVILSSLFMTSMKKRIVSMADKFPGKNLLKANLCQIINCETNTAVGDSTNPTTQKVLKENFFKDTKQQTELPTELPTKLPTKLPKESTTKPTTKLTENSTTNPTKKPRTSLLTEVTTNPPTRKTTNARTDPSTKPPSNPSTYEIINSQPSENYAVSATNKEINGTKENQPKPQKGRIGQQKCKIPKFDAYHPQVQPFVRFSNITLKKFRRRGKIKDGRLHFNLKGVEKAGFHYIRRRGDIDHTLSEFVSLIPKERSKGEPGCIRSNKEACVLRAEKHPTHESLIYVICDKDQHCLKERHFVMKNGRIFHANTEECLVPDVCAEMNTAYDSNTLGYQGNTQSWQTCQRICQLHGPCVVWTYNRKENRCYVKKNDDGRVSGRSNDISGPEWCIGDSQQRVVLAKSQNCNNQRSLFNVLQTGQIQHRETGKCVHANETTGEVMLAKCAGNATHFHMPKKFIHVQENFTVKYPLKEEFIKVIYVIDGVQHVEYHAHVIKEHLKYKASKRTGDELNILMVMMDSQSNKNTERQLRKTFKYLKGDPNTVILENHVITGDATTANLVPLLSGHHVADLPEARPWYPKHVSVDKWPLIFDQLRQNGYVTMYSDDDPPLGGFQFRLSGFRKQPTDKYLLPYMRMIPEEFNWLHKHAFDYLKDFVRTYNELYKTFAFISLSTVGHNGGMNRVHLADNDILDVYKFFAESANHYNTAIIFFGDHGQRVTAYRQTIWGKLEERLPWMSVTLPTSFVEKHKMWMRNLRRNSQVMTSHFDMYQTLRHMLSPTNYERSRKKGESLFNDVVRLNRTCDDVGVPVHYCPCTEFKPVNISDTRVKEVCTRAVDYINEMLRNMSVLSGPCVKLSLKEILRAQTRAPSREMQLYEATVANAQCDRCHIVYDRKFKMKATLYEVLFRVSPSDGIYETTVEYLHDKNVIHMNGEISRVNRYGEQPACIAKKYPGLRKYCFCKT